MPIPAYDKFVKTISNHSTDVYYHAGLSWNGINLTQREDKIIEDYLLKRGVGVDYLNNHLSPILSQLSYEVKFASVFVHKKPRVNRTRISEAQCIGNTPRCELGDLLIIFCFLDAMKNPIRCSAVLSQAKKNAHLDSLTQKCLYENDTEFEMPGSIYKHSIIKSPLRKLPDFSQGRTKALTYSILNPIMHMRHVPWSSGISANWGVSLERLLIGDLGLEFKGPILYPDWNCVIHDLVQVGQRVIPTRTNRGNALRDVVNIFNAFNEYENYSLRIEDSEGVPMMFVIVKDKEYVTQQFKENK